MLVLTRRLGDELGIGDARVRVVEVAGELVRLGVTASPNVVIYRPEQGTPLDGAPWGRGTVGTGQARRRTNSVEWGRLNPEQFEELIFRLVSGAKGYENAQWVTKTNAPDKGRDLSASRVHEDELAGTRRLRVVVACKHWLSKSVGVAELSLLRDQMTLWEPPRVDVLAIATSGHFSADALQMVEKQNASDRALTIEMWPRSHLENLVRKRPDLAEEFGLL